MSATTATPRRAAAASAVLIISLVVLLASGTSPAAADPPQPTNYESRILSVEPPLDGASVEIQGGDAFVVLTVAPGREALVPDYGIEGTDRPYLRFRADGEVQVNENSAAASANESRFGSSSADFDPESDPRWRTVASGGSYAWHDHRVHLMVPDDMAVVDETGRVDLGGDDGTWSFPLVIGDTETTVRGELVRLDAPSAWPWYLIAAAVGALMLILVGLRSVGQRWTLSMTLLVVAASALYISLAELRGAPPGSGAQLASSLVAATAVVGAAGALVIPSVLRDEASSLTLGGTALAAATLLWWAVTRLDVLGHAVLPSNLGGFDRAATTSALGIGAATAVLLVWRPDVLSPNANGHRTSPVGDGP